MPAKAFRSAFDALGSGVTPAQVLAFHRLTFGDCRMENDGGDANDNGDNEDAGDGSRREDGGPGTDADKPLSEMTTEERAAYFEKKANRLQGKLREQRDYADVVAERDRLKAATQTDAEKAIEQARNEARDAAMATARAQFSSQLVAARLEAALAGKMPAEKIASQVEFLDHAKFLTESGEVDTEKVKQYAAGLAPAGNTWPDLGNGNRGRQTQTKGVAAGADLFAASRGKKTTT
jgi:hypothetical protein